MDRSKRKRVFKKICEKLGCKAVFADRKGYILESTENSRIGQFLKTQPSNEDQTFFKEGNLLLYSLPSNSGAVQFIGIEADMDGAESLLKLMGIMVLDELDEMTREDFILESLTGKFSDEQLLHYMKKFNLPIYQRIQTLVVQFKVEHGDEVEFILNTLYPGEPVLRVVSNRYVIIRRPDKVSGEDAARGIYQTIFSELVFMPFVGVGIECESFLNLKESYDKAVKALELGILHDPQAAVYSYRKLSVPLMIDHMDFHEIESLYHDTAANINAVLNEEELIVTALRFFENDLNITETSRKLYVHRNTLIYRLNKIYKLTHYDLRKFEDALNFSIGLYLNNVLKSHGS